MNIGIYSFCTTDLNPDIAYCQRQVFENFNLKIEQYIETPSNDTYKQHGECINKIIEQSKEDYLIIFDIDSIPLNKNFYNIIVNDIYDKNTLAGAVGCANHLNPDKVYVHPCFMAFHKKLYFDCDCPPLHAYGDCDVAQRFTDVCMFKNKKIKYWEVTDSYDRIWDLKTYNTKFGHGTIFKNLIYHQYEVRMQNQQQQFIDKCKEVINNSDLCQP